MLFAGDLNIGRSVERWHPVAFVSSFGGQDRCLPVGLNPGKGGYSPHPNL